MIRSLMNWVTSKSGKQVFVSDWEARRQEEYDEWRNIMSKRLGSVNIVPAYKGEYRLLIPWGMQAEVEEWLTLTFGPGSNNKRSVWRKHQLKGDYYIRGEQNVVLARLRWEQ